MARKSRTPYIILGLLSTEPMSGYELKANIAKTVGHFWKESYGQLYPALQRLVDEGLVKRSELPVGGRTRHRYSLTAAGRAAFAQWLAEPPEADLVRNETLLKIFFGRFAPKHIARRLLENVRDQATESRERLCGLVKMLEAQEADAPELDYWLMTVDYGRRMAEAKLAWAEASLKKLT